MNLTTFLLVGGDDDESSSSPKGRSFNGFRYLFKHSFQYLLQKLNDQFSGILSNKKNADERT